MQNLTRTNTKVWVRFENLDPTRPIGLRTPTQTDPILRVRLGRSRLNLTCATGQVGPGFGIDNPPTWQPMGRVGFYGLYPTRFQYWAGYCQETLY